MMSKLNEKPADSNPLELVVMWIRVDDALPNEPKRHDQKWVDVWADGVRITDVNFFNGEFHAIIEDYQGDFEGHEKISEVTHWMIVEPPST